MVQAKQTIKNVSPHLILIYMVSAQLYTLDSFTDFVFKYIFPLANFQPFLCYT